MASKKTNIKTKVKKGVVNDRVGSYEKHPFFVKKANNAKAFLEKVGLPAQLVTKGA